MADVTQAISALRATSSGPLQQIWKEISTGYYGRLNSALLVAVSSNGTTELVILQATTSGALHAEMQPSTEAIGHVTLDASTARIGSLYPSTERIGSLYASTETIGALYPSTNAIGFVSGHMTYPTAVLAVTTSAAYSSGDGIGGETAFTGAFRSTSAMQGILQSLIVTDKGSTGGGAITFLFLDTQSTGAVSANHAALAVADGDLGKIVARVAVSSGDYLILNDNAVAVRDNLGIPVRATTGTALYALSMMISTGLLYATTGEVNLKLGILAD